jgi:hypothetical protein
MSKADALICQIIEDLLDGRVDFTAFWEKSKGLPEGASSNAEAAWVDASHYVSDEDIRARDPEYQRRTTDQLRRHLQVLGKEPRKAAE